MIIPQISATERYITNELFAVAPLPVSEGQNGQFKIQLVSERGRTKWLNITPAQYKKIEEVLLSSLDS